MKKIDYSIIIPVFNSEASLEELLQRIHLFFKNSNHNFEIICVNDKSEDKSWELLQEIKKAADYPLTLVSFSKNFGQHKALLCGMQFSKGAAVVLIDADLQIPPEEINQLIERKNESGADIVYGEYASKQHSKIRNKASKILGYLLNNYGYFDARGSSFKIIDRTIVDQVINAKFEYIFIDEILSWYTSNIEYVTVTHLPRKQGSSSYSTFKLISMALQIILNYTALPLRLMTYSGLLLGVVCFCFGIYFLFMKILYGAVLGFTAIIISVLFSAGIMLFSLGIIGEYLRKIYYIQLSKPPFIVKRVIK